MDQYVKLQNWLEELNTQFGDKIPEPEKIPQIVSKVEQTLNSRITQYLGQGDNGIAFKANDKSVIKYTIDKNEAILWNRLKNEDLPGIAKLQNVLNISSSKTGDTYLYVIKVEFIAYDLTQQQKQQINQILKKNTQPISREMSKNNYIAQRTANMMAEFEILAEQDPAFELIPDLLADLADKHRAYIYDLRADNFKKNRKGQIILIDPSVPDLLGDVKQPEKIMFEDILNLTEKSKYIII